MRTSAIADVRWRPGTTYDTVGVRRTARSGAAATQASQPAAAAGDDLLHQFGADRWFHAVDDPCCRLAHGDARLRRYRVELQLGLERRKGCRFPFVRHLALLNGGEPGRLPDRLLLVRPKLHECLFVGDKDDE